MHANTLVLAMCGLVAAGWAIGCGVGDAKSADAAPVYCNLADGGRYKPYRHYRAYLAGDAGVATDVPQAPATDAGSDRHADGLQNTDDGPTCVALASVLDPVPGRLGRRPCRPDRILRRRPGAGLRYVSVDRELAG